MSIPTCNDNSFGPGINLTCRKPDFTLLFEQTILSIAPSALFLLFVPWNYWSLIKKTKKVNPSILSWIKPCCITVFGLLQLALLALWAHSSAPATQASIAAAALGLLVALAMGLISNVQHMRSLRPSTLLNVYLLLSLLCDIVQMRTLWMVPGVTGIAGVFTTSVILKLGIILAESLDKRSLLKDRHRNATLESTSGIWNKLTFWWVNPLLWKGSRNTLNPDDLPEIQESLHGASLERAIPGVLAAVSDQYSLLFALFRVFWRSILSAGVPRMFLLGLTFAQPFLINRMIAFVAQPVTEQTTYDGYGLIVAFGLVYIGLAVSTGMYAYTTNQVMIMVRGALVTAIYRRTLELNVNDLDESAAVTLMSTDVEQVMLAFEDTHEAWANLAQIGVAVWLLAGQVSWACVAPIVVSVASVIVSGFLSPHLSKGQRRWNKAVQTRIDMTTNVLGQMKELKILGLTFDLTKVMQELRSTEIEISTMYRIKLVVILTVSQIAPLFAPVTTFALYVVVAAIGSNQALLSAQAFTSLSLISILSTPITILTQSFPVIAAGLGALARIQEYLSTTSRQERRLIGAIQQTRSTSPTKAHHDLESVELEDSSTEEKLCAYAITIDGGEFSYGIQAEPALRNVRCSLGKGSLTIIVGSVVSGKTTFLKGLLNELPSINGSIAIQGSSMAFCDQNPWLMNATVQTNIAGESVLDYEWYRSTIKSCALDIDLAALPLGDQTLVGSKGMTLSRGQKQRIAIARALYAKADIILVDDALSGLDRRTERQVFDQVFGKEGLFRRLGSTMVLVTHANHLLSSADWIIMLGDNGEIKNQGPAHSLPLQESLVLSPSTNTQADDSYAEPVDAVGVGSDADMLAMGTDLQDRRTGDWSVYSYYLHAAGYVNGALFSICVVIAAFCYNFPNLWLQWWSDANEKNPNAKLGMYLGVYTALAIGGVVALCLASWCFQVRMVSRSGSKLHGIILRTVMKAPLSFFASVNSGSLTNRFSQDMRLIDTSLPLAAINTSLFAASCLVQVIIISISSKYMSLTIPAVCFTVYFVQNFYLRTSRQLRLLDLDVKSPLYSNFIETLNGLVTIRAFGWSSQMQAQNTKLLDESQKPVYLLYCVQRWLTFVMDMLVALLAIALVTLTVMLKGSTSGGEIGVALVNIMTISQGLTSLIKWYTSLETALGAISRVKTFQTGTASEERARPAMQSVEPAWLPSGAIELRNVSASYNGGVSQALRDISMSVEAGQKIGICGRSGSGKSSFILVLCQMLELSSGSITADGIDLSTLPYETVRSGFNSITQEPFFIPATVRMNLDFTKSLSDADIIDVLEKVKLWNSVQARGGLNAKLVADTWSLGEQQLFCLARALLKKSRVLILDEVSSSVDSETDQLMQSIIREEFAHCTIFAIAHRLETILDFDKIALLDKGALVEFDSPETLLAATPPSAFARLYHALPDAGI